MDFEASDFLQRSVNPRKSMQYLVGVTARGVAADRDELWRHIYFASIEKFNHKFAKQMSQTKRRSYINPFSAIDIAKVVENIESMSASSSDTLIDFLGYNKSWVKGIEKVNFGFQGWVDAVMKPSRVCSHIKLDTNGVTELLVLIVVFHKRSFQVVEASRKPYQLMG